MSTSKTNLEQAYKNVCALIAKITRKPKPNYNVDGQRVDWANYLDTLTKKASELKGLIDEADDDDIVEEHTSAVPR